MLSRTEMLARPPLLKTEKIPVPEFGEGECLAVRALTAKQRWDWGKMATKATGDDGVGPEPTAFLITLAAIDEGGAKMFQGQDADNIAEWPGELVDRIGTVIMEMSGLSKGDKAVKDAEKNSETTPTSSEPTSSPSDSGAPSES